MGSAHTLCRLAVVIVALAHATAAFGQNWLLPNARDPLADVVAATHFAERSDAEYRRGIALIKAGQQPAGLAALGEAQDIAGDGLLSLRENRQTMRPAELFARRVSAPVERWLSGRIVETQIFLNRASPPSLERIGTDLAFFAALSARGTGFAEALERRAALRGNARLFGEYGAIEALAELDAGMQLAPTSARAGLRERLAPTRARLLRRLGLNEADATPDQWWRSPGAAEARVNAAIGNRPLRTQAILADLGAHGLAGRLPHGALMLAYHCTLTTCFLFGLHPSGEVRFALLPSSPEDLTADLATVKARLAVPYQYQPPVADLAQLAERLLGPVQDWLAGTTDLFLLPDGPLFAFPFAVLPLAPTGLPLVAHMSVTVLPSGPWHPVLDRPPAAAGPPLVVGIGRFAGELPLQHAEAEAQDVAALLGTTPLLGAAATRARLLPRLAQAPVIHIATHAKPDRLLAMASSLVLPGAAGRDDAMLALDVLTLTLTLRARLVVLSACETGYPEPKRDEEVAIGNVAWNNDPLGLARAFLLAGAAGVVASHWAVDDPASARLMVAFHRALQGGAGVAQGLRQAQDAMRRAGAPPRHWAPFFVAQAGL